MSWRQKPLPTNCTCLINELISLLFVTAVFFEPGYAKLMPCTSSCKEIPPLLVASGRLAVGSLADASTFSVKQQFHPGPAAGHHNSWLTGKREKGHLSLSLVLVSCPFTAVSFVLFASSVHTLSSEPFSVRDHDVLVTAGYSGKPTSHKAKGQAHTSPHHRFATAHSISKEDFVRRFVKSHPETLLEIKNI